MLGRFFWLRLYIEWSFEADFFLMIDGHVQEFAEMLHFPLEIGIKQGGVTFPAPPKNVTFTFQLVSGFQGPFHLSTCVSENIRIRARGSSVHVARMNKQTGSAPEQAYPGSLLFFFEDFDDLLEVAIGFLQSSSF